MYYIMNAVVGLRIVFTVCIILSLCCSIRYSFLSTIVIASTIDYDGAAIVVARGLETIPDEPMLKINTNAATIRNSSSKTSTISHKPGLKQTINAFGILMLVGVN